MNIQITTIENPDGTTAEHVIIDRGNGEFTSMPKDIYDEMVSKKEGSAWL